MNFLPLFARTTESYSTYDLTYTSTAAAASVGFIVAMVFLTFVILAAIYVVHAYLLSRVFKKAGVDQWIAWVPFYNSWKLLELGGQQGFWAVLAILPIVNYVSAVFMYIAMYHIGLKFGKDGAWVVLAIFLPTVWLAILAFDSSKWNSKKVTI
jgi:hypothetical protein